MSKLTFLGVGSAFNFKDKNVSAVIEHHDNYVLLDCGITVPEELMNLGILEKITHVFITHTHSDHIGGLELFAQYRFWVSQHKGIPMPTLVVPQDILDLLRHVEATGLDKIQDKFGRPVTAKLETYFDIEVIEPWRVFAFDDDFAIQYFPVNHVPGGFPSYGFFIKGENKKVCFSGDTRDVIPSRYTHVADIIFHDCQLFDLGAGDVHCSYEKLDREMEESEKPKTLLMHYGNDHHKITQIVYSFENEFKFAGFVQKGQEFTI